MNKKIQLISLMLYPQFSNGGVDRVAGFLRSKGYSVDLTYFHNDNSLEEVINNISYDYAYFGIYVDIKNVERCIAMANHIKEKTGATIWFGGTYVASCFKDLFDDCFGVDYIILGGGEEPLQFLLSNEGKPEIEKHPNIATRTSLEEKRFNESTVFDYNIAEDYFIRYPASRGFYSHCIQSKINTCSGKCVFCINWCMERDRLNFVFRSTDSIVNEIKRMYQAYGIRHFFFIDDDILDPDTREAKNRICELCRAIIDCNMSITITGYTKANALSDCKEDHELLKLMNRAGFVSIFVGIESGSDSDLKVFNKQANIRNNKEIITLLYNHNIKPEYEMITFHPYTTIDSLKENYLFLRDIHSCNLRQYALTGVSIYQNTQLYQMVKADGLLGTDYSYKNPDSYHYLHEDVAYMAKYIKDHFDRNEEISSLVNADKMETYYYRFSRYSQSVRILGEKVKKTRDDNYKLMEYIFEPLYVNNDYDLCNRRYNTFVEEYKHQVEVAQNLINRMLKLSILDQRGNK